MTYINLFFLILSSLLTFPAHASSQMKISCSQGPGLSTFLLRETERSFNLRVHHEQGVEKAVIHSGEITPSDFEFLEEKAQIFTNIGQTYSLTFPKDQCFHNDESWHCFLSTPLKVGKQFIDSLSFYIYPRYIESGSMSYTQYRLGIEVRVDNQLYNANQSFYNSGCNF